MSRHIVFAAGGTGGHVIPAQQVAEYVKQRGEYCQFMACGLVNNPFFDRDQWPFIEIPSAPTSCRPWKACKWLFSTICGIKKAFTALKGVDMVVGFGSYHTVPVLIAASLRRIPFVLYEANTIPGRVIALFSRYALWTGCCFEETVLHGQKRLVQHPIRTSIMQKNLRKEAFDYFQLPEQKPVMLVLGGSLGASWFNVHIPDVLAAMPSFSVIHLAGADADIQALHDRYTTLGISAVVKHFENRMELAYSCADRAIARSGASAVAELSYRDIPTVYIPYRYAMDDHQRYNALSAMKTSRAVLVEEGQPIATIVSALQYVVHAERHTEKTSPLFGEELMATLSGISL